MGAMGNGRTTAEAGRVRPHLQLGVTADWLLGIDDTPQHVKPSIEEQLALLKAQLGETSKSMEGIMAQISRLEKERGKP